MQSSVQIAGHLCALDRRLVFPSLLIKNQDRHSSEGDSFGSQLRRFQFMVSGSIVSELREAVLHGRRTRARELLSLGHPVSRGDRARSDGVPKGTPLWTTPLSQALPLCLRHVPT